MGGVIFQSQSHILYVTRWSHQAYYGMGGLCYRAKWCMDIKDMVFRRILKISISQLLPYFDSDRVAVTVLPSLCKHWIAGVAIRLIALYF